MDTQNDKKCEAKQFFYILVVVAQIDHDWFNIKTNGIDKKLVHNVSAKQVMDV